MLSCFEDFLTSSLKKFISFWIIFSFLKKFRIHICNLNYRSHSYKSNQMLFIKVWKQTDRSKHLCRALAVSNISNSLLACFVHDIIPQGWLVIFSHLTKREAKVLIKFLSWTSIQIYKHMISRISIASRIIHPQIKTSIY